MDIIPSDLATYGSEAKKAVAGFAEPKRENVPGLLFGAEHSGQSPVSLATTSFRQALLPRSITAS